MKKIRLISLILAGCMILSGCSGKEDPNHNNSYNDDRDNDRDNDRDENNSGSGENSGMQGTYNEFQKMAETISNAADAAFAERSSTIWWIIYGDKVDGSFSVNAIEDHSGISYGVEVLGNDLYNYHVDNYDGVSDDVAIAAENLWKALFSVVPDNSSFYIDMYDNWVGALFAEIDSELYSKIKDLTNISYSSYMEYYIRKNALRTAEGFDNAYIDLYDNPVGVSGRFVEYATDRQEYYEMYHEMLDRYADQIAFYTFQETMPKEICDYANSAIFNTTQFGFFDVENITITGQKNANGQLAVFIDGVEIVAASSDYSDGDYTSDATAVEKVGKLLFSSMLSFLPNNSSFYVSVDNLCVARGVICTIDAEAYPTGESLKVLTEDGMIVEAIEGFDGAYTDLNGVLVGVYGDYVPRA